MKGKKTGPASSRRESTPFLEASKQFDEGVKLLYSKSPKKAREAFQQIIDHYGDEKEMADRAKTYIKICEGSRSRVKDQVLESAEDYFTRATFRFNEGDIEGAIQDHQEALRYAPKADHIHYSLAGLYAIQGDAEHALKALEKALKLNPDLKKSVSQDDDFGDLLDHPGFAALLQTDAQ